MQDLVIRIVFILGNLTAKSNQARELFSGESGSVETLLTLFQNFYRLEESSPKLRRPGARPQAEAEDVLVKLTRVLANIAIHPRIGPVLAANPRVVGLLLTTLGESCSPKTDPWEGRVVVRAGLTLRNPLSCERKDISGCLGQLVEFLPDTYTAQGSLSSVGCPSMSVIPALGK